MKRNRLCGISFFFSVKDKAFTLLNNLCGFALTNELIFNQGKPQTQPSNVNCMNIGTLYLQSVATHTAKSRCYGNSKKV